MKALYLDESGEHNPSANSADYPIFVLGGIIADKDYTDGLLTDMLDNFKRNCSRLRGSNCPTGDIPYLATIASRVKKPADPLKSEQLPSNVNGSAKPTSRFILRTSPTTVKGLRRWGTPVFASSSTSN